MDIGSLEDLQAKEDLIRRMLQRCRLDSVLLGLRRVGELDSIGRYPPIQLFPFMIAGAAMFAMRYCRAWPFRNRYSPLPNSELVPLIRTVNEYLLADPLSFDSTVQQEYYEANPAFTFLRFVASQFPFQVSPYGQYGRSLVLYGELPLKLSGRPGVPSFDFAGAFEALNGVAVKDFVKVGWIAWLAARSTNHLGFTREYFEKAVAQGIELPQEHELLLALDQLTTTKNEFISEYDKYRSSDPRFAMYNFNPLVTHPLVRPFNSDQTPPPAEYAMIAPCLTRYCLDCR
jgi:hypothetical protein